MPGILHSTVLSFPSESRFFELLKGQSQVVIEGPLERADVVRAAAFGLAIELTGLGFYNPTADNVDLEVTWVTPDGNFVEAVALTPQSNAIVATPFPLMHDEQMVALVAPSSVGDRVHAFVSFTDVTGKRIRKLLTSDWQSIFPETKPNEVNILVGPPVNFIAGPGGGTVELRLVRDGLSDPLIATVVAGPGGKVFVGVPLSLAHGDRVEARLTAGSGFIAAMFIARPETHPLQGA